MKVLHLFPVHEVGGAEAVALNIMRFRSHPDVVHEALVISSDGGELGRRLTELSISWARIPRGRMSRPSDVWRVRTALRREIDARKPDVLFSNSSQGFLYGSLARGSSPSVRALYQMSVPAVRWWENGPLDWMTAIRQPDIIFTASDVIASRVRGWSPRSPITVHHGTPEPAASVDERAAVGAMLTARGVPSDAPLVLMPGRLQRWKGQRVFVDAFARVLTSCPDAHAVCLGSALFGLDADYPEELRGLIRSRGLEARVHLVPHQPIAAWLERATIVVHASTEPDAFPNVCIEALASSRALITNTLAGTAEVVRDRIEALVVEPRSPAALTDAIVSLLTDRDLREHMAAAGRRRYLASLTPLHMVEPIERTLAGLCLRQENRSAA